MDRNADVAQEQGQFTEVEVVRIQDQCGHVISLAPLGRFAGAGGRVPARAKPKRRCPTSTPSPQSPQRVRALAELFVETDLLRLRIEREGEAIELGRRALHPDLVPEIPHDLGDARIAHPVRAEQIRADLVGIFHLSRPAPSEGDLLESDRELAFIERSASATRCAATVRAGSWRSDEATASRSNMDQCSSKSIADKDGRQPFSPRF